MTRHFVFLALLAACSASLAPAAASTCYDTLASGTYGDFSYVLSTIESLGTNPATLLLDALKSTTAASFTFFIPLNINGSTDFTSTVGLLGTLNGAMTVDELGRVPNPILYTFMPTFYEGSTIPSQPIIVYYNGSDHVVTASGAPLYDLGDYSTIITPNIDCASGIIHVMDMALGSPVAPAIVIYYFQNDGFSIASKLYQATNLNANLGTYDQQTTLLTTDAGFANFQAAFGPGLLQYLLSVADTDQDDDLVDVLTYHQLNNGTVSTSAVFSYGAFNSPTYFDGNGVTTVLINPNGGKNYSGISAVSEAMGFPASLLSVPFSDASSVPQWDLICNNGLIQPLDGVLIPPGVTFYLPKILAGLNATTTLSKLNATGFITTINGSPYRTILVPTNDAWDSLDRTFSSNELGDIITYNIFLTAYPGINNGVGGFPPGIYNTSLGFNKIHVSAVINGAQTISAVNGLSSVNVLLEYTSIAQNGYAYLVDSVLLPPYLDPAPSNAPTNPPSSSPTPPTNPPSSSPTPTSSASWTHPGVTLVVIAVALSLLAIF